VSLLLGVFVVSVALVAVAFDASPGATAGLAGLIGGAIAVTASTWTRRPAKPKADTSVAVEERDALTGSEQFTNVAFSDQLPTWRGWRRDVGVLTIHSDRIVIDGLKRRMVLNAPFQAALFNSRWMHWQMAKVTGSGSERPTTVYLVGRGAPRSKFSANPGDLFQDAMAISDAINDPPEGRPTE